MTASDKRRSAPDIAALVRRGIFRGTLRLHDRLPPERALAETHGAARGTIRKAMALLEAEGLVETRAGSGTYVIRDPGGGSAGAVETATPLELMDARFALEPHICRLSVLHGRHADFDRMRALCARMESRARDPDAFSAADTEFHRALVESTRNGLLIRIIDRIARVRRQEEWTRMRRLTLDVATIGRYNAQHRRILDALCAREPEHAANMMKEHLESARLSLTRASET